MILYFIVAVVCIILSSGIVKQKTNSIDGISISLTKQRACNIVCIAAVFLILFLLGALRIEVGNDYGNYVVTCHEIFQRGYVVTEPGYNLLVRILYTLSGKEDYLLMFGFFAAVIPALFIKTIWDLTGNFFLGFYLYMGFGIFFRSFNTVRYYFALALAMYSLKYLIKEKQNINYFKFIIIILLAATFHKSVLVVIPVYLLCSLPWKKWFYSLGFAVAILSLVLKKHIISLAYKLYPSYVNTIFQEQQHTIYENVAVIGRCIVILAFVYFLYGRNKEKDVRIGLFSKLSYMGILIYLAFYYLPLVTRLGYYCITPQIYLIPALLDKLTGKRKKIMTLLVLAVTAVYFIIFLKTGSREGVRILPYKSFLFTTREWLNQTDTF